MYCSFCLLSYHIYYTSTGLVEIEVLDQLEVMTGKSIPELFDWVVATSTGAIIILGLLYGM